jgi:DNA invertase Pin-like site-specific DNA recombinase
VAEPIVGYAPVSTGSVAGVDRIYVDHGELSRKVSRPQWDTCLDHLHKGDVLLVYRLDQLSSSDQHFISLFNERGERGVDLRASN